MDEPNGWLADRGRRHRDRLAWARGPRRSGPLRRTREEGLAGGVAAGLALRTGFDVTVVRLVLVVGALATSGFLAACYVVAWLVMPADDADGSIGSKALTDRRGIALSAGLLSLLAVLLLIASVLGAGWFASLAWPQVITIIGLVLIWRNAPEDERATMQRLAQPLLTAAGEPGPGNSSRAQIGRASCRERV